MLAVSATAWAAPIDGSRMVYPAGSVLKVRLDDTLSSDRNQRGDRFTATVTGEQAGYDLPSGTRVEGVVREATPAREDRPGVLDVDFSALRLPDGQSYRLVGAPISLDSKSVQRTSDGRLVARSSSKNRTKFIAYGAGAGFILGSLLGENITGTLLGAAAGYLYGRNSKDKANGREVLLRPGTEFGVRLDQRLALTPARADRYRARVGGYRAENQDRDVRYRSDIPDRTIPRRSDTGYSRDSYIPSRSGTRYSRDAELRVMVNDRDVRFSTARPYRTSDDRVLVPAAPVLDAAGIDFRYDRSLRELTLNDPREVSLREGSTVALVDGRRVRLSAPARIVDGTFYVPADFFDNAVGMRARWDDRSGELILNE
jgi:hypothetical protein